MKLTNLTFLLLFFTPFSILSQKDTQFWFAAPDVLENPPQNYDRPTVLRFSTYEQAANVTVFQPANPGFGAITLSIPAHSTKVTTFNSNIDDIENKPANTVLNKGLLILSDAPISAYYEVISTCICNPEIFSLKGKNALGTSFFVPFQTALDNSTSNRWSAFDIVATENSTVVTITPTQNLIGHSANVPFSVTLQRGQTWSGRSESALGSQRPTGTRVISNKPIAITMKDDLVNGAPIFQGECRDLLGDQLVPIKKTGTQYVINKGVLNNTEFAFVLATQDNTQIKQDGLLIGTINEGEQLGLIISGAHFIQASSPVYLLQVTGIGCELSAAVLPSLDCSGSQAIRFVRTTNETFYISLVTRNGNQDDFLLNGAFGIILPSSFNVVPGSGGQWVSALIPLDNVVIPAFTSHEIKNLSGVFQMAMLNGQESATGSRFGFFSDFDNTTSIMDTAFICSADSALFRGVFLHHEGNYTDTLLTDAGCDTIFHLNVQFKQYVSQSRTINLCAGDSILIGNIIYSENALAIDTMAGTIGCDTIGFLNLVFVDVHQKVQSISFCPGDTVFLNGNWFTSPGTVQDTLKAGLGDNCDTLLTTNLIWQDMPTISQEFHYCNGDTVIFNGMTYISNTTIIDTLKSNQACDTIRTTTLVFAPYPGAFLSADTSVCQGESVQLHSNLTVTTWLVNHQTSPTLDVTQPGIYIAQAILPNGCTWADTVLVTTCCLDHGVYVPNIFTPNDDGTHDSFQAFAIEQCRDFKLLVYDRWGSLLFESSNPDSAWDGTCQGKNCPAGVYIWTIIFNDHSSLKGDITLLR